MSAPQCDATRAEAIKRNSAIYAANHLTKAQKVWLVKFRVEGRDIMRNPYVGGWECVTWKRMARRMEKAGICFNYVDGDYRLTEHGERVIEWMQPYPCSPHSAAGSPDRARSGGAMGCDVHIYSADAPTFETIGRAPTLLLALCIAALKAREASKP